MIEFPDMSDLFKCHTVEVVEMISSDGLQHALRWLTERTIALSAVQDKIDIPALHNKIEELRDKAAGLKAEAGDATAKQVRYYFIWCITHVAVVHAMDTFDS